MSNPLPHNNLFELDDCYKLILLSICLLKIDEYGQLLAILCLNNIVLFMRLKQIPAVSFKPAKGFFEVFSFACLLPQQSL